MAGVVGFVFGWAAGRRSAGAPVVPPELIEQLTKAVGKMPKPVEQAEE